MDYEDDDDVPSPDTAYTLTFRFRLRDSYSSIDSLKQEIEDSLEWLIYEHDAMRAFEWVKE